MEYRFSKDPLFGKYCYIDTPWIAGKNTIYRIINSGVRSNAWVEVPISGREEVVLHDHQEDVVFVVLDTLISEDSRIKKVALKDVKVADSLRECPWCKAICASTDKYCHECGWHIADTPQTEAVVKPYKPTNREILDAIENSDCPWK